MVAAGGLLGWKDVEIAEQLLPNLQQASNSSRCGLSLLSGYVITLIQATKRGVFIHVCRCFRCDEAGPEATRVVSVCKDQTLLVMQRIRTFILAPDIQTPMISSSFHFLAPSLSPSPSSVCVLILAFSLLLSLLMLLSPLC